MTAEPADGGINIVVPMVEDARIELDGRLDEDVWSQIPGYDNLAVTRPDTLAAPAFTTDMRFFTTATGLYVGVRMEQPVDTLVARLSSRDIEINRDSWGITLDTSGEGLYGYWFVVNLGGTVRDGKILPERVLSQEWDGPWDSATTELEDGWGAELFLPWSMMAMPGAAGPRTLRFWVDRVVAHLDERWSWPALPEEAPRFMSALGTMQAPGVAPRRQLEIFPNVSYTLDEIDNETDFRPGLDLSWRPTTNLQVTATANPDFGVVESDDVVVNLTAFETFFPEKRLFFLEGREVFTTSSRSVVFSPSASQGVGARQTKTTFVRPTTTLLNTRRIGGPPRGLSIPDDVTVAPVERGKPTDLLGAVKVTGQSGSLRYGVLGAFEDDVSLPGVINSGPNAGAETRVESDGRDFGVARLLWEDAGEGRLGIGYMGTMVRYPTQDDAIVHGVDGRWLSRNGAWQYETQLMQSDVSDTIGRGILNELSYRPRQGVQHRFNFDYLDTELNIRDLGFIRRNDAKRFTYRYSHSTGRGLERLRQKRWSVRFSNEWNIAGEYVRGGVYLRNAWTLLNRDEIRTELNVLPKQWDDRNSFGNGSYRVEPQVIAEIAYGTDTSKKVSWSGLVGMRQEDLGDVTYRGSFGVTYRPVDRFSLEFDVDYFDRDGWILHQEGRNMSGFEAEEIQPSLGIDVFLTAKQQFRVSLQWVGIRAREQSFYVIPEGGGELMKTTDGAEESGDFAISRLTAQLRYRWEIDPLSDLFVVYTRGSNLPGRVDDEFDDLFTDAIEQPIVDLFVVKLRYRFGL